MQTAADRGTTGVDNEWGAGLLDVRALVDAVAPAGSAPATSGIDRAAFPTTTHDIGSVGRFGTISHDIVVPADATGAPLVVMLTLQNGQLNCDLYCQIGFSAGEWSPDIGMRLYAPDGSLLTDSQCTLSGVTCAAGRQETVAVRQPVAGTYRLGSGSTTTTLTATRRAGTYTFTLSATDSARATASDSVAVTVRR